MNGRCSFENVSSAAIEALGKLFRRVVFGAFVSKLQGRGARLDDRLRRPMRLWHTRRSLDPAAILTRLFVLDDDVPHKEVEALLGNVTIWLENGLLVDRGSGIGSTAHVVMMGDLIFFGDPVGAEDAVLPPGGATIELLRVVTGAPAKRVLDLGCGSGALAIAMARLGSHAIATDVNPRAAALTRFNARLNDVEIDVRVGDAFEPVRGETFDRVVTQPPFHALGEETKRNVFVHGGRRGDEFAHTILQNAREYLSDDGVLVLLADFPILKNERSLATRFSLEGCDVLVARSPNKDLDEYCAIHTAMEHVDLGSNFVDASLAKRDHLETMEIQAVALTWIVVRRSRLKSWVSEVLIKHPLDAAMTWHHLARMLRAHDAAFSSDEILDNINVRKPGGARFVEQPIPNEAPMIIAHPPPDWPEMVTVLDAETAAFETLAAKRFTLIKGVTEVAD